MLALVRKNSTDATIPLIRGYNREREADAVARHILAYVESSEEARYRDVCIMLRESETYGDTLEKGLCSLRYSALYRPSAAYEKPSVRRAVDGSL